MSKLKDLINQQFGYLTIIERAENTKQGLAQWKCKCKCGNIVIVRGSCLRNGHTQSCGCKQKEASSKIGKITCPAGWNFEDLTGQRFGKLTVIKRFEDKTLDRAKWLCQCDCGNTTIVSTYDLKHKQHSCGCILSYKEMEINKILKDNNIKFEQQYSFNNLCSDNNKPLRFDFAIFNNNKLLGLIEYQGEQHFLEKPRGFYTTELLNKLKYHDQLKIEYCKKYNIPLLLLDKTNILEEEILLWIKTIN